MFRIRMIRNQPRQRDHQIKEVAVALSSTKRTDFTASVFTRLGTLLSVAERHFRFPCSLVSFAAFAPFALSNVAPRVAPAMRREEKQPWAHRTTAR
jgi:hypothetical protein